MQRRLFTFASLALSRARFQAPDPDSGGKDVPNAVPVVVSLGATRDVGGRWFAGVRGRHVGAYPLEPTGQVRSSGFWTAGLRGGFRPKFAPGSRRNCIDFAAGQQLCHNNDAVVMALPLNIR